MRSLNRRAKLVCLAFAFTTLVLAITAAPGLGQKSKSGAFEELTDAQCYSHHAQEGFRSMDLFPERVTEVAAGQPFTFHLTIQNPWLHEILGLEGFVNISKAPGFRFPGEKEPFAKTWDAAATGLGGNVLAEKFPVDVNATEIHAWVEGGPGPVNGNDFDLAIESVTKKKAFTSPADRPEEGVRDGRPVWRESILIPYADVSQGGTGDWRLAVTFTGAVPTPEVPVKVGVTVYYNLSRSVELRVPGPDTIKPGQSHTFAFTLYAAANPGTAEIIYGGFGDTHHKHTDPNAQDHGDHTKFSAMSVRVGTATLIGDAEVQAIARSASPLMKAWGQVLGYAASFLLVPVLVLGGTFGPASVNGFNRLLGARRRILWHNATSFLLLAVAVLHLVLFLGESFWPWSKGVLWGSLALACMVGLAFNGAMQKRFVGRWGFARWRFAHFGLGILMVVFTLVHLAVDGSHFQPVLKWMGLV